ncbi:unnamed protein product [Closterium sp. NIES-54]
MLALCREHRLEHRTKHIALRYFLARELQQRGQLRLAYVASQANTADIFTNALPPGDHQRFCTMLGFPTSAKAFWNSPVGPKTSHFWGPLANWGFVIAGLVDMQKPVDMISPKMTSVMCVYSALFMRFAWRVQPRNYLLFSCHSANETVQLIQLSRWALSEPVAEKPAEPAAAPAVVEKAAE